MTSNYSWPGYVLASVLSLTVADVAHAQSVGTIRAANANTQGGAISATAAAAKRNPLPMSEAEVALKREADGAGDAKQVSASNSPSEEAGDARATNKGPAFVDRLHFFGLGKEAAADMPANVTGAIGPSRYIQASNGYVRIYGRVTKDILATAPLNKLAGNAASVENFNSQVIWDPTTNRFYYVMNSVFGTNDNRLSFGFSKTANPASISSTDWCQYDYTPANPSRFPDYPKLGDNKDFLIVGVNSYIGETFRGADLIAISKPAANAACPAVGTFKVGTALNIRDTDGKPVFTPVPANQVDDNATGYVVARAGTVPSNHLWFFNVTNVGGNPVFGPARVLNVEKYTTPPNARQPTFKQLLNTLDARPTQAVQAVNPLRNGLHSFYVQHTVRDTKEDRSVVRWYEINPVAAKPVVLRTGNLGDTSNGAFFFNAAISPDRANDGTKGQYGESFVIQYNVTSRSREAAPRIVAASSFRGQELKYRNVRSGKAAYQDSSCPVDDSVCKWQTYSGLAPDPRPTTTTGRGEVWGTNQASGKFQKDVGTSIYNTWIFALQP